jgi:SAM-dependent methyltransferase
VDSQKLAAAQERANAALWARDDLVDHYRGWALRPVEVLALARFREELSGGVLEIGPGTGRITSYLLELGADAVGLDVSPSMVEACREALPDGTFEVGDMRDLSRFETASFDAIIAANNVIDVLGPEDRVKVLREFRRVLVPGGLLLMSSHNRAAARSIRTPARLVRWDTPRHTVRDLTHLPRLWRNRRRLLRYERHEDEWAVLNDVSHDFLALHYYISRDTGVRQLLDCGFEAVECFDAGGNRLPEGAAAPSDHELFYTAWSWAGAGIEFAERRRRFGRRSADRARLQPR